MNGEELDISEYMEWQDGLPVPQWSVIEPWIETRCAPGMRARAWDDVSRQWLTELVASLPDVKGPFESKHFIAIVPGADRSGGQLLQFAERCRGSLQSILGDIAQLDARGKQVVVALDEPDEYYRYIAAHSSDGEHGTSAGVHIREGLPHVALHGSRLIELENTLAHELTHASLQHLSMPQWVEEGLAQIFEHDMTGRSLLLMDREIAEEHQRYWRANGLGEFWSGEGFSDPGPVQRLSYRLAEVLMRLMIEEGRVRWFGLVREPQRRFFQFLRTASTDDCGQEACERALGYDLTDLAARFLGPGPWEPYRESGGGGRW